MIALFGIFLFFQTSLAAQDEATVASKTFTESFILAEIAAQVLATNHVTVDRRLGLGGTGLLFEALEAGEIDFYPEYTGTIAETIIKDPSLRDWKSIQQKLIRHDLRMTRPLGFDNSYAIAVSEAVAEKYKIASLSDLKQTADQLRWGISTEFVSREDGWTRLQKILGINPKNFHALSHELAYRAIGDGHIDVTDIYSTDAKIEVLKLRVLKDDLAIFPQYQAVYLATNEFIERCPACWKRLQTLENQISIERMRRLNQIADVEKKGFANAAEEFLSLKISAKEKAKIEQVVILERTKEHLFLVLSTLLFSIFVGIPLGFIAYRWRAAGRLVLGFSGLIQTVPSLALLCLLVPVFGIGQQPALIALCLYGLLPVVTNTCLGLVSISPILSETALAIGLTRAQRFWLIQFPLASRSIWAGLKTSTIITIGTATLAALIGAGGLGAPIVQGLAVNDIPTILEGAIPAALLALVANVLFDLLELIVIPKGLRIK